MKHKFNVYWNRKETERERERVEQLNHKYINIENRMYRNEWL